jgi:porphobilinogen synthase
LLAENSLKPHDLIWPLFILPGNNTREAISSMPGVERLSIDLAVHAAKQAYNLGIPALALFPKTENDKRSDKGEESYNPDNLMCRALSAIKSAVPEIVLIADVALDPYTSHGHDGLLENGVIWNDGTVEELIKQSLVQAKAGADIIAPSDMMDGRIGAIRDALEAENFTDTQILSYTAKYASCFYGPFRDAIGSSSALKGDKKTYQMNPANGREAELEAMLDENEGADMLMVKPGLPYLDIIYRLKQMSTLPVLAYQVSGEYAMMMVAGQNGWLDQEKAILESLVAFKRAGADAILSYAALEVAKTLHN